MLMTAPAASTARSVSGTVTRRTAILGGRTKMWVIVDEGHVVAEYQTLEAAREHFISCRFYDYEDVFLTKE
jgi:hypothetical protein